MNTQTEKKEKKNTQIPLPLQTPEPSQAKADLEVKKSTALSTEVAVVNQTVLNSDILIPRILLMQGLSPYVVERKAQQGDIVRSVSAEILGGPNKPISFIPLKQTTSWVITEKVNDRYEFRGIEPRNSTNDTLEWTFVKNGTDWKRTKAIGIFALLVSDIEAFHLEQKRVEETGEAPDLEKTLMPVFISFQSTSFTAGKMVSTFFTKAQSMKAPPYKYFLSLSCELDKNDKGSFYVWKVGASKPLPGALVGQASQWYEVLNAARTLKVDSEDETSSSETIDVETSKF